MFVSRNRCDLIAWFDDSAEACSEIELQDLFLEEKKQRFSFSFSEKKTKRLENWVTHGESAFNLLSPRQSGQQGK